MTFQAQEVADGIVVGPMPDGPEAILTIRNAYSATAIVSVQTDGDLAQRGMNWLLMWRFLMAQGFALERVPIEDFDEHALERGLDDAVDSVQRMRAAGHRVYLHCTAGVNRSPSVAIAYLVRCCDMSLDDAFAQVTSRRSCLPNRAALQRWDTRRRKA